MGTLLDPRLKLRHLQCLVALVNERSVVRAADSLAHTPSAVSKTLTELEDLLAAQLFLRKRSGLQITPVGQTLYDYATQALGALAEGLTTINEGRSAYPPLNVGALPTVVPRILPMAVQRLCASYPDIVISIHTAANPELLKKLKLGELDVVIGRLGDPKEMYAVSFEPLFTEPLIMAVSPSHPLAHIDWVEPEDVRGFPMVLPLRGTRLRDAVDAYLITSGIGFPRQRIESISSTVAYGVLKRSTAIWFCPLGVVADELDAGTACRLRLATESTTEAVGLSTLTGAPASAVLQRFIEAVREVTKDAS